MKLGNRLILLGSLGVLLTAVAGCSGQTSIPEPPVKNGASASFAEDMSACLLDSGYQVEVYEDGTFGIDLPEGQMAAYDRASSVCAEQFGYNETPQLTEGERRILYEDTLALVQCLEDHGYPIENVPSEQVFIDGVEFVPYEQVPTTVVGEDWQKLNQECPQP